MPNKGQFEIPDTVRELAERNVEQARAAYEKFSEMAKKAQEMAATSGDAVASTAREIQAKALGYTQQNVETGFSFASDLARARDMKEFMDIQTRYAQAQMKNYTEQAQELGRLMGEAMQKAQPKK